VARALLLLSGALCFAGVACTEERGERLNREGNAAYERGEYQRALDTYREAQVETPDVAAITYNAGNALHRLGQLDRAIPESQRASASGPDEVRFRAYYALGNHYFRQERLRESRDAYKNALKLNPSDVDAKFNLEVVQRLLNARQQPSPSPSPQPGQPQPGQPQPGQSPQPGQPGDPQPGQPQPGQPQPGQPPPGETQPGQARSGGQQSGQQPGQPGAQPLTPQELERAIREAEAEYERNPTVESALRVLELLAQEQRLRQRQVPPQPSGNIRDQ